MSVISGRRACGREGAQPGGRWRAGVACHGGGVGWREPTPPPANLVRSWRAVPIGHHMLPRGLRRRCLCPVSVCCAHHCQIGGGGTAARASRVLLAGSFVSRGATTGRYLGVTRARAIAAVGWSCGGLRRLTVPPPGVATRGAAWGAGLRPVMGVTHVMCRSRRLRSCAAFSCAAVRLGGGGTCFGPGHGVPRPAGGVRSCIGVPRPGGTSRLLRCAPSLPSGGAAAACAA
jgi:hypothetical protein